MYFYFLTKNILIMENSTNLKRVFTGSVVEAQFIKQYLEDNNIDTLLRNTMDESMIAGWASGAPEDSALIFVFNEDYDKAIRLIEKYQSNKI